MTENFDQTTHLKGSTRPGTSRSVFDSVATKVAVVLVTVSATLAGFIRHEITNAREDARDTRIGVRPLNRSFSKVVPDESLVPKAQVLLARLEEALAQLDADMRMVDDLQRALELSEECIIMTNLIKLLHDRESCLDGFGINKNTGKPYPLGQATIEKSVKRSADRFQRIPPETYDTIVAAYSPAQLHEMLGQMKQNAESLTYDSGVIVQRLSLRDKAKTTLTAGTTTERDRDVGAKGN